METYVAVQRVPSTTEGVLVAIIADGDALSLIINSGDIVGKFAPASTCLNVSALLRLVAPVCGDGGKNMLSFTGP
jgi:hypothetical protein